MKNNAKEVYIRVDTICATCQRDQEGKNGKEFDDLADDEICPLLGAAFNGVVQQWGWENGKPTCSDYWQEGEPDPGQRCTNTADIFQEGAI